MSKKRITVARIIIAALAVLVLARAARSTAEPEPTIDATAEQIQEFEELIRLDQRILFDATVSGDFSQYPTIYFNDPTIAMHADYQRVLSQYGDEARVALAALPGGPKGGGTGYLTARIASLLSRQANVAAWESAQATAIAEGREPSALDLPNGFFPMERVTADQWIEADYHIFDVQVGSDHATANLAFGPPEAGGQILSYVFARVNGQWYISYMESSWSQGDHDYLNKHPVPTPAVEEAP